MRFNMKGVEPNNQELIDFRSDWQAATCDENRLLNGEGHDELSTAQRFTIDLFCGAEGDWAEAPRVLTATRLAQVELEAVIRGRNRALAAAMHREGRIQ